MRSVSGLPMISRTILAIIACAGLLAPASAQQAQPLPASTQEAQPAATPNAPARTSPAPTSAEQPSSNSAAQDAQPPLPDGAGELPAPEAEAMLPHDLTPWGMFMAADWVVKGVMIGLAFASLVCWTVWLAKSLELFGAKRRASRAIGVLGQARSLHEGSAGLRRAKGVVAGFARAAERELGLSADALEKEGAKERVASRLERMELAAGRRMSRGTGVLATIGATAPFVGLFGTVWGIMNAFIGISKTQTTNLAVVAPGIAEALLATALGLVAAIPAVVIYNVFARAISGYRAQLGDGAAEVMRLVSRDLDRGDIEPRRQHADRAGLPAAAE